MMKNTMKMILLFSMLFVVSACTNGVKANQNKIDKLSEQEVTRISLQHYHQMIEIKPSDPNFETIIDLTCKIKLASKYSGDVLYGVPIDATFYSNDEIILIIAPGVDYTNVDEVKFNTSKSSVPTAEALDTLLGSYFGYDQ